MVRKETRLEARLQRIALRLPPDFQASAQADVQTVIDAGANSVTGLIALLDTASPPLRAKVCFFVGRIGDSRCVPVLLAVFQDKSQPSDVRWQAATELSMSGSRRLLRLLLALLRTDAEASIRRQAAYALGLLGYKGAVGPLRQVLNSLEEEAEVRAQAAESLGYIGDRRAVRPLIDSLRDPDASVRFWAAFALGHLRDEAALPELERLASRDGAVVPGWGTVSQEARDSVAWIKAAEGKEPDRSRPTRP